MDKGSNQPPAPVPGSTPETAAVGGAHRDSASSPPPLRLEVTSDTHHVAPVRKAVEAFALAAGLGPAAADLGLVVNEALANVIRHAYRGEGGRPISVAADCDGSEVRLTIRDWGSGANPAALPMRPRDPATPGGLGLLCLRALMDRVVFAPQPDGMLLTITKRKVTKA